MNATGNIEKVKLGHHKIYSDIVINTSAEKVWQVLSNTSNYKNWAAFLVDIEGEIKDGGKITAKFQLDPNKANFNSIDHTIQVTEGVEFYWAEKGPMGITDNHHFKVEPINDNSCKFIQTDELTKGATWLLGGYLAKTYLKGYQAFNLALKNEAEQIAKQ